MTPRQLSTKTLLAALLLATLSACIEQNGDVNQGEARSDGQSGVNLGGGPVATVPGTTRVGSSCESFRAVNGKVTTATDAGCVNCGVTNAPAAIDGDVNSAARVVVNSAVPAQGVTLRATAQAGVIFPAGRLAGLYYSAPAGTTQNTTVTISTLAGGVVQELSTSSNTSGIGGGRSKSFSGIRTTKPFDAVEIAIRNSQVESEPVFQVFEFCSDLR